MTDQTLGVPSRSGVAMTPLQQAYTVGRMPELPLGGVECLTYLEFRGRCLDADRLQRAVDRVHHHAALRCRFVLGDEALLKDSHVSAPRVVVRDVGADPDRGREEIRHRLMQSTIDIGKGADWGVALSTAGEGDQVLHLVFSLASIDAAALGVILHELAVLYNGTNPDQYEPLETVGAVRAALQAAAGKHHVSRRKGDSSPLLPGPELSGLREIATDDVELTTFRRGISQQKWKGLLSRAKEYGVSPAALVLTVYEGALRRWSANDNFCVTLAALDIRRTGDIVADRTVAYAHRAVAAAGFEQELQLVAADLRRRLAESRDAMTEMRDAQAAGSPVAASRCVFTYATELTIFSPLVHEVLGRPCIWGQTPQSAIDCRLLRLDEDTIDVAFDVRTAAIPLHIAEAIFELFLQNLEEVVESGRPHTYLPRSQVNARELLNSTPPTAPRLIHDEFREQVGKRPASIAIEESRRYMHNTPDVESGLSYAELDRRALAFGGRISRLVQPGGLVAVQLPRGVDQVVAILGILYAGCAYLPIGPGAPQARLERIRERSQWSLLVTPDFLDGEDAPPLEKPVPVSTDDLAYVIYTSGSTGEPKGVAITHAAAANTITDVNTRNHIGPGDVILGVSGIDFDLSVYDIFGTLSAGGRLVMVDDSETRDPFRWGEVVRRSGATIWNSVPMLLEMLTAANESLPSLRAFLISGDRIPLDLPARSRAMSPGSVLVAMGGATEASIWSNEFIVNDATDLGADWPSIPYGKPLTGQKYRVVDANGHDRPDECVGELMIGGVGLARGYHRDPEHTSAAFVDDADGQRWYRTGDLGMWRDGLLFIVGRKDTQVKIRGHRIECGEVEARLCEHPGVDVAAVVPIRDRSALGALYVPVDHRHPPEFSELSSYLASHLPWYMVPAVFRPADELPVTANGKVDRAVTASLVEQGQEERPTTGHTDDSVQSVVADSWEHVLGCPVDAGSNFFALGGNSLAATRMCAQLRETGLRAELSNLFRAPVLAAFADTCRQDAENDPSSAIETTPAHRPDWRDSAAAQGVSLSSLGFTEWCRWVWRHELSMRDDSVTITDDADFFALGGDSLTGARVCSALRASGVDASVATLFRYPKFDEFQRNCTLRETEDESVPEPDLEDEDAFDLTPLQLAYALGSDGIPGVVRTSPCVAVIVASDDPTTTTRWEQALREVVARHEALRLVRCEDWRQRVVGSAVPEFAEIPFPLTDAQFRDLLCRTSVDAGSAPAVRGCVRRNRPDELGLVFNYLALDSLSVAAVLRDLAAIAIGDVDAVGPAQDIGAFRRYALAQNQASTEATIPAPTVPRIPAGEIPKSEVVFGSRGHVLDAATVRKLRGVARRYGVTLNSVFLRAYGTALAVATGQQRVTINIPAAGRPTDAPEALGQFSDLALCECGSDMDLREIHAQLGRAIAHAGMVAVGASTQRQRYPVVFTSLLGSPLAEDLAGGAVQTTWTHTRTPAVLIDCQVMPTQQNGIELRWDHPHQVISEDFIEMAFTDFIGRVLAMADDDEKGAETA